MRQTCILRSYDSTISRWYRHNGEKDAQHFATVSHLNWLIYPLECFHQQFISFCDPQTRTFISHQQQQQYTSVPTSFRCYQGNTAEKLRKIHLSGSAMTPDTKFNCILIHTEKKIKFILFVCICKINKSNILLWNDKTNCSYLLSYLFASSLKFQT